MDPAKSDPVQEAAIRRIGWWILALTAAGGAGGWLWRGGLTTLSIVLGGILAYYGFRTHVQVVDRALRRRHGRGTLWRALLRYGLIAFLLYGMIRLSFFDIQGFLIGLLLPAAAVLIEGIRYLAKNLRG